MSNRKDKTGFWSTVGKLWTTTSTALDAVNEGALAFQELAQASHELASVANEKAKDYALTQREEMDQDRKLRLLEMEKEIAIAQEEHAAAQKAKK